MPDIAASSDPITLGFDTSAAHCAAALLRGGCLLGHRHDMLAKGQAERLFPMLEELLAEAGLHWRDLSVIGVGIGPGNFTGIRIAVAAARGLSLSLKIPAIGVTVTEALAFGLTRPCRVVMPARRDQVIWEDFSAPGAGIQSNGTSRPRQTAAGALPPGAAPAAPVVPLAEAVARIALDRRHHPAPRPAPFYLRPADAAPAREPAPVMLP